MKKYLAIIITAVLLSLSLCAPALAAEIKELTLSEDYKELYFQDATYVRVDADMLSYDGVSLFEDTDYYEDVEINSYAPFDSFYNVKLTKAQKAEIDSVEVTDTNVDETLFFICISFNDGSVLYVDFIREDIVDEYHKVIKGETKEFYVNFRWPEENVVTAKKKMLSTGSKEAIDVADMSGDFPVYAVSSTGSFDAEIGVIIIIDEKYYYCSYSDSTIKSADELWLLDDTTLEAIQLTDEDFLAKLDEAKEAYYGDDYGFLYNDELTQAVAKIFFILAFALAPLAIAVATLVLAIKAKKGLYKKLLLTTSALSFASVGMFIWVALMLFK